MINIAIVGATGLVGRTFLKVLEERNLSEFNYTLFASKKSAGKTIKFFNKDYIVEELSETSFDNNRFDFALFSAGATTSKKFAPLAASQGTVVIDNSSAFRMDNNVPLVVPEVNSNRIFDNHGIIANPNCSTIQAVVALKPLQDKYGIKRVLYSTYQAVSGAGKSGIDDFINTSKGEDAKKFPYKIYNNCIPQIDVFLENDYTKEEMKMIEETRKILEIPELKVSATCVRVPVLNSHSECIDVQLESEFNIDDVKLLLAKSQSIALLDDPIREIYPLAAFATEKDDVFVGRVRRDFSVENGLHLWVVADNIRKGAATNAIQILQKLVEKRT